MAEPAFSPEGGGCKGRTKRKRIVYTRLLASDAEIVYTKTGGDRVRSGKDAANVEKHGVSLARTADLDILAVIESSRPEDKERRFRLYRLIDGEAHCAVVTWRQRRVRAISLRRANRTERKRYGLQAEG